MFALFSSDTSAGEVRIFGLVYILLKRMSTLGQSRPQENENEAVDSPGGDAVETGLCEERKETVVEQAVGEAMPEESSVEGSALELDDKGSLLKALEEAQAKALENHDRYLRAVADLENFRKRVVREKDHLLRFGMASFLEDFLPVMDNLMLGLDTARRHPEAKPVTDGFAMVLSQLEGILKDNDVTPIDPEGEPFDPNLHHCVQQVASEEVDEGTVMTVARKGYLLHNRLLRPATVVVSTGPKDGSEPEPVRDGETN